MLLRDAGWCQLTWVLLTPLVPLLLLLLLQVQKQSLLSHTAQDSQALWEEELKSRSKLGLRLAELEKERGELNTQVRRPGPPGEPCFSSSIFSLLLLLPSASPAPPLTCHGDGVQVEMEKKKVRKVTEQKRAVDSRLEQEMQRNTELQKEMYR